MSGARVKPVHAALRLRPQETDRRDAASQDTPLPQTPTPKEKQEE